MENCAQPNPKHGVINDGSGYNPRIGIYRRITITKASFLKHRTVIRTAIIRLMLTPLSRSVMRGSFITFEGIDGSGKSTVASRVLMELKRNGACALLTREPTDTWLGDAAKRLCKVRESNPFGELFLFMADRAVHTDKIKKWLSQGRVVLCDRYFDSTVAYQGVTLKPFLKGGTLEWLSKIHSNIVIKPDITFLLKLSPDDAIIRISPRKDKIKFERAAFLADVQKNYLRMARNDRRFVVIDAALPLEAVVAEVMGKINKIRVVG